MIRTSSLAVALGLVAAGAGLAAGLAVARPAESVPLQPQGAWAVDSAWYDGLVEKATYDAVKVIYGRPRTYEATFLTNKEQHDTKTWTKADGSTSAVEVWKHNQIEVVPTPNYDYKFVTTTHATVEGLSLTRLDATSQEWCGTAFHQYEKAEGEGAYDYFAFSYMPEQGRVSATVDDDVADAPLIPFNGLSLYLRGYDFDGRGDLTFRLLPDQKSNKLVDHDPVDATVTFAGETGDGYQLALTAGGEEVGTFEFAKDRQHVMLSYEGVNGDSYQLKDLDRVDYWTRDE